MSSGFRAAATLIAVVVLAAAGAGAADAAEAGGRPASARVQETPAAAMARLDRLVGDWTGTAETRATPYRAASASALDAAVRQILGGNHLEAVLRYQVGEQPLEGRLTVSWEPHEQRYSAVWIDSVAAGAVRFAGQADAAGALVLVGERRQEGRTVKERLVIAPRDGDRLEITSSSNAIGDMTVGLVIRATRRRSP
jgi:hypothetical protein